jgi:hypothetical protein
MDNGYYDTRRRKNLIIDRVFTWDFTEFIVSPLLFRELSLSFKASLSICGFTWVVTDTGVKNVFS